MSNSDSVEVTAASVDDAIKEALERLGALEEDVVIEVLMTPRSGVLGLGARQARVRVTHRPPLAASSKVQSPPAAPHEPARPARTAATESEDAEERQPVIRSNADLERQGREATEVLSRILVLMGERAEVKASSQDSDSIELEIRGDGSGVLIGRHGQTLDSLEYLVNRILARRSRDAAPISLETESYRARRRQQLHRMALSMGEKAKREHQAVTLEPMPPRDRRIVHLALKDDPMLTTRSTGDGFLRSVEILPAERRREREGRERHRERNDSIGEQGGFKHGQKRIV